MKFAEVVKKNMLNEGDLDYDKKPAKKINAEKLAAKVSRESEIKVNFTGAWDRFDKIIRAQPVNINRGNGFEMALKVSSHDGVFIYMPPFKMYNEATDESLLMFYADDALFIQDK